MVDQLLEVSGDNAPVPLGELLARVSWIVLQFALAYYLGHPDVFFYQGF
jgi:hypothetical protein